MLTMLRAASWLLQTLSYLSHVCFFFVFFPKILKLIFFNVAERCAKLLPISKENIGYQLCLIFALPNQTPGSPSPHHALPPSPQQRTCVTADAGKLDSVHRVENYNTWPVGLETRLVHAPFFSSVSAPPLIWSTCGVLRRADNFRDRKKRASRLLVTLKYRDP